MGFQTVEAPALGRNAPPLMAAYRIIHTSLHDSACCHAMPCYAMPCLHVLFSGLQFASILALHCQHHCSSEMTVLLSIQATLLSVVRIPQSPRSSLLVNRPRGSDWSVSLRHRTVRCTQSHLRANQHNQARPAQGLPR